MSKPKVSVIVPVYNSEKYLSECVCSLLNQTYRNIEVILVDDGSTDSSFSVCESFSRQDSRVLCFHNENHGVSYSRNFGISKASGLFIIFVDSDDYLLSTFIEQLVLQHLKTNSDIVIGGLRFLYSDKKIIDYSLPCSSFETVYSLNKYYGAISENYGFDAPVGKLLLHSIIANCGIQFNESISILEDQAFVSCYLEHCKTISTIADCGYVYIQHNSDTLIKRYNPNFIQAIDYKITVDNWMTKLLDAQNLDRYRTKLFRLYKTFFSIVFSHEDLNHKCILKGVLESKNFQKTITRLNKKMITKKERVLIFLLKHRLLSLATFSLKRNYKR